MGFQVPTLSEMLAFSSEKWKNSQKLGSWEFETCIRQQQLNTKDFQTYSLVMGCPVPKWNSCFFLNKTFSDVRVLGFLKPAFHTKKCPVPTLSEMLAFSSGDKKRTETLSEIRGFKKSDATNVWWKKCYGTKWPTLRSISSNCLSNLMKLIDSTPPPKKNTKAQKHFKTSYPYM